MVFPGSLYIKANPPFNIDKPFPTNDIRDILEVQRIGDSTQRIAIFHTKKRKKKRIIELAPDPFGTLGNEIDIIV